MNPGLPAIIDDAYNWEPSLTQMDDAPGIKGQNQANPPSIFRNHQVAIIGGKIYDPSYGRSFPNMAVWTAQSCYAFCINMGKMGGWQVPWQDFMVCWEGSMGCFSCTLEIHDYPNQQQPACW